MKIWKAIKNARDLLGYVGHVISCIPYWRFYNTCYIMFISHVSVWRGWWWSYRRQGCQASDHCSGPCFNISKFEMTGYFWRGTRGLQHLSTWRQFILLLRPQSKCDRQNRYFNAEHDLFQTLTLCFLSFQLTTTIRPQDRHCHNMK